MEMKREAIMLCVVIDYTLHNGKTHKKDIKYNEG